MSTLNGPLVTLILKVAIPIRGTVFASHPALMASSGAMTVSPRRVKPTVSVAGTLRDQNRRVIQSCRHREKNRT